MYLKTSLVLGVGIGFVEALQQIALVRIEGSSLGGLRPVGLEILWVAPVFDSLFFLLVGTVVSTVSYLLQVDCWNGLVRLFLTAGWAVFLLPAHIFHPWSALLLATGLGLVCGRWVCRRRGDCFRTSNRLSSIAILLTCFAFLGIEVGKRVAPSFENARLPNAPRNAPNVLLIVIDTLRADHLAYLGYQRATSPNIDRISQQGITFENAFSTSSWTVPSHCSLLNGLLPSQHGAHRSPCSGPQPRLPEILSGMGYRTGGFTGNTLMFTRRQGFQRGFQEFQDYFHSPLDMALRTVIGSRFESFVLRRLGVRQIPARKTAPDVNRSFLSWVDRDQQRPFFAMLNFFDAHDPFLPPAPYDSAFSPSLRLPGKINTFFLRYNPDLTPAELQGEIDGYDGAVRYVDHEMGRLFEELASRNLLANTLIVITSDHGESFGEHGLLHHGGSLYLEQTRVPLLFCLPGKLAAGRRIRVPVSIASIPSTILELAGGSNQLLPGPSLGPLLWGSAENGDYFAVSELAQMPEAVHRRNPNFTGRMESIITGDWHLILHQRGGAELYRWTSDSAEAQNLAHSEQSRQVFLQLSDKLDRITRSGFARSRAPL